MTQPMNYESIASLARELALSVIDADYKAFEKVSMLRAAAAYVRVFETTKDHDKSEASLHSTLQGCLSHPASILK